MKGQQCTEGSGRDREQCERALANEGHVYTSHAQRPPKRLPTHGTCLYTDLCSLSVTRIKCRAADVVNHISSPYFRYFAKARERAIEG